MNFATRSFAKRVIASPRVRRLFLAGTCPGLSRHKTIGSFRQCRERVIVAASRIIPFSFRGWRQRTKRQSGTRLCAVVNAKSRGGPEDLILGTEMSEAYQPGWSVDWVGGWFKTGVGLAATKRPTNGTTSCPVQRIPPPWMRSMP